MSGFNAAFVDPLRCNVTDIARSCIEDVGTVLLVCVIAAFLTVLLVLVLIMVICCMACKIKKLNSLIKGGKESRKDGMRLQGVLENPLYNDLPMNTDFESGGLSRSRGQDPSYHEIQGNETAVPYETMVPSQRPSQQLTANYDDVTIDNYHLLGEENMNVKVGKSKLSSPPSSARIPADNYDDIILPNRNIIGQDKDPGKGYGKPPAMPPTEVKGQVLEYCEVTEGAKVVVQGAGQTQYNHLVHQHQHSASTSMAMKPKQLLECYSNLKLADSREHSSSVGERPKVAWEKDSSHRQDVDKVRRDIPAGAAHTSVNLDQLLENIEAEILYCTVPESSQGQGGVASPRALGDDASLYMNVKH